MEFLDVREADDAIYHLDRTDFMGREITVIHSRESRKTPNDMLARESESWTVAGPGVGDCVETAVGTRRRWAGGSHSPHL